VTSSLGLGWFKLHAVAVASRTGHRRGETAAARAGSRRGIAALARLPPEATQSCTALLCAAASLLYQRTPQSSWQLMLSGR
jgi:hypothetical protein